MQKKQEQASVPPHTHTHTHTHSNCRGHREKCSSSPTLQKTSRQASCPTQQKTPKTSFKSHSTENTEASFKSLTFFPPQDSILSSRKNASYFARACPHTLFQMVPPRTHTHTHTKGVGVGGSNINTERVLT